MKGRAGPRSQNETAEAIRQKPSSRGGVVRTAIAWGSLLDALEQHAGGTLKGPIAGRMSRIAQGFAGDDLPHILPPFGAELVEFRFCFAVG
jgi:hypothetical protein